MKQRRRQHGNGFGLGYRCFGLDIEGDDVDVGVGDVGRGFAVSNSIVGLYNRCWRRRRRCRWLLVLCVVVTFCFEPIKLFVFVPQIHLACAAHFWPIAVYMCVCVCFGFSAIFAAAHSNTSSTVAVGSAAAHFRNGKRWPVSARWQPFLPATHGTHTRETRAREKHKTKINILFVYFRSLRCCCCLCLCFCCSCCCCFLCHTTADPK